MAKKKNNLKDMTKAELDKKLVELSEKLRTIRFKAEGSKTKNVKESLAIKKQVAQIMTVLNQQKAQ